MGFCLVKKDADAFREALKSGKINPEKLAEMSSKERREFFEEIVGKENAKDVNNLFESKMLLKNQQQALITWAQQSLGMKPAAKRDLISRIEKMDNILNPADQKAFLEDLAAHKLGVSVSLEEAKTISELAKKAIELKEKLDNNQLPDRLEYGRAQVELNNYINDLKLAAEKTTWSDVKQNPGQSLVKTAVNAPGFFKSIQAAFDDSAIFQQGWKPLWTHPNIWRKNALKTFRDIYDTWGGKAVADELNADIVSRPNYDLMKKAKLDVGSLEEAYPTSLPEKYL
jgi:hypothetical protein